MSKLMLDGPFWRRLARLGASRFPEWWVHYSPPLFGWAAALMVPEARRAVLANLRRVRGERPALRDALDVASTFSAYASCLAEVLSNGSKNERLPSAVIHGEKHLDKALAVKKGLVITTVHSAGWETVGPLLSREHALEITMVMARERSDEARRLHDAARAAAGLNVAHVGEDPLSSLSLLHHLRRGNVVALQLDRAPPGMRTIPVTLFGGAGVIPEGPLRLAALTGAPVLPIFCARTGYRDYVVDIRAPIFLRSRPDEAELSVAAQRLADEMTRFLRAHPTQWFHFHQG
jgi:KDO2-lipid IV(A) lauroyltransferase